MLAVYTSPFKAKAGDTQIWGPCTSDHTPPSAPPAFGILSYTISKMQQRLWFHQYSVHGEDPNVHQKDTTPQQGLKGKAEKLRPAKEAKEKELVLLGWIKLGKLDKNPYPQDPCMVYLPTFTKSIMYVNITCRDPIWMTVDRETLWSSWFLLVHLKFIIYPRCSKAFAKEVDRGSRCQWQFRGTSGFGCVRKKTTPLDDWMDQFIPFRLTGSIGCACGRNNLPPLEEDILMIANRVVMPRPSHVYKI